MTILLEAGVAKPLRAAPFARHAKSLAASPANALVTLAALGVVAWAGWGFLNWAVFDAAWTGGAEACRSHGGACWPFVTANWRLMLFGVYPDAVLWRPIVALALMGAAVAASLMPAFWGWPLFAVWAATPALVCALLGGAGSATRVSSNAWGGLPLTFLVWMIALGGAFAIAIPLALARRSRMGGVRTAAIACIELVRGTPMLVTLYVSSFVVPMSLPGVDVNLFASISAALVLFVGCYLAEVIRAGLQALPKGQTEAALALGFGYWMMIRLILLPQALRAVLPALVNLAIGVFLATPLMAVIGMIDFLSAVRKAANQEQDWPGCYTTAYFFAGLIFFLICFSASRYSRWLETRLNRAADRAV